MISDNNNNQQQAVHSDPAVANNNHSDMNKPSEHSISLSNNPSSGNSSQSGPKLPIPVDFIDTATTTTNNNNNEAGITLSPPPSNTTTLNSNDNPNQSAHLKLWQPEDGDAVFDSSSIPVSFGSSNSNSRRASRVSAAAMMNANENVVGRRGSLGDSRNDGRRRVSLGSTLGSGDGCSVTGRPMSNSQFLMPNPQAVHYCRNTLIPQQSQHVLQEVMQSLLDDYPTLTPLVKRLIYATVASHKAFGVATTVTGKEVNSGSNTTAATNATSSQQQQFQQQQQSSNPSGNIQQQHQHHHHHHQHQQHPSIFPVSSSPSGSGHVLLPTGLHVNSTNTNTSGAGSNITTPNQPGLPQQLNHTSNSNTTTTNVLQTLGVQGPSAAISTTAANSIHSLLPSTSSPTQVQSGGSGNSSANLNTVDASSSSPHSNSGPLATGNTGTNTSQQQQAATIHVHHTTFNPHHIHAHHHFVPHQHQHQHHQHQHHHHQHHQHQHFQTFQTNASGGTATNQFNNQAHIPTLLPQYVTTAAHE